MKSLEIVNERIKYCKDILNNTECNELERAIYQERLEEYETIKQDLEVLEIIRNKRVNVAELVGELIYFDNDEDALEDYNSILCKERQLTLEELLKLKQWLEVNEND